MNRWPNGFAKTQTPSWLLGVEGTYRATLTKSMPRDSVRFAYRTGPESLLPSQLAALEPPHDEASIMQTVPATFSRLWAR